TTHAARDRGWFGAVGHRIAVLTAQHEAHTRELTHRANLVVHHTDRERDPADHLLGDVRAALLLRPSDPEAASGVKPRGDVAKTALEVGDAVHEQDRVVDQRLPQVFRDTYFIAGQGPHDLTRRVQETHLVTCLDPELLGQWLPCVPSHGQRIMQRL